MKILVDDDDFDYLAIYSDLRDYELSFEINKKLGVKLERSDSDIVLKNVDLKDNCGFSLYEYFDDFRELNLVSNSLEIAENKPYENENQLFLWGEEKVFKHFFLFDKHKKVNFVLKVQNDLDSIDKISYLISTIKGVIFVENIKLKNNVF